MIVVKWHDGDRSHEAVTNSLLDAYSLYWALGVEFGPKIEYREDLHNSKGAIVTVVRIYDSEENCTLHKLPSGTPGRIIVVCEDPVDLSCWLETEERWTEMVATCLNKAEGNENEYNQV